MGTSVERSVINTNQTKAPVMTDSISSFDFPSVASKTLRFGKVDVPLVSGPSPHSGCPALRADARS